MVPDPTRLRTLQQFAKEAPAFPVATVRHWIRCAQTNGFDGCYIRVGGRVYVDPLAISEWLAAQQTHPRPHNRGIAAKRHAEEQRETGTPVPAPPPAKQRTTRRRQDVGTG